ncbi:protein kinase [Myxococcota bacterium]|nr:protein kinase [Myxococcota bacterium]
MSDSLQFGQLLIADGLIQRHDWQAALRTRERQGGHLLEILMGLCPVSEQDLYRAIARQLGLRFWTEEDILHLQLDTGLLQQFPPFLLLEHSFLPWRFDQDHEVLHILLPNPLDHQTIEAIKLYAQIDNLSIGVATPSSIVNTLQIHFRNEQNNASAEKTGSLEFTELEDENDHPPNKFHSESAYNIAPPKLQLRPCPACGHQEPVEKEACSYCGSPMDLAQADPLLHKNVSHFRLDRKLGEGGMGLVYQAVDIDTQREAAVKILRSHLNSNERVVRRFHREAQAQNQLRHPNIVYVHDFGFEDGVGFFIAMEFLRGQSLEDVFEFEPERLNIHFLQTIFRQVCDGMGFAHSRGIFHRDLKPDNLFLMENPSGDVLQQRLKILDFGVAKMVASDEDQRLTRTGMTIGTPRYMSPEQAGEGNTDHRSDIYSLGVILFECLTGQPPFEGSSAYQIMLRHVYAEPPKLAQVRSDLAYPQELESLVARALAKDPQKRPPSMDMFWHELSNCLDLFKRAEDPHRPLLVSSPHARNNKDNKDDEDDEDAPVIVGRMIHHDKSAPVKANPLLAAETDDVGLGHTPSTSNLLVSLYESPPVQSPLLSSTDSSNDLLAFQAPESPLPILDLNDTPGSYAHSSTPLTPSYGFLDAQATSGLRRTPKPASSAPRTPPPPAHFHAEQSPSSGIQRAPEQHFAGKQTPPQPAPTSSMLRRKNVGPMALKSSDEKSGPSFLALLLGALLLVLIGGGATLLFLYFL